MFDTTLNSLLLQLRSEINNNDNKTTMIKPLNTFLYLLFTNRKYIRSDLLKA